MKHNNYGNYRLSSRRTTGHKTEWAVSKELSVHPSKFEALGAILELATGDPAMAPFVPRITRDIEEAKRLEARVRELLRERALRIRRRGAKS